MKVEMRKNMTQNHELNIGDIVDCGGSYYILMKAYGSEESKCELRDFDGIFGACGKRTLDEMRDFVNSKNYKVLSKKDYKIVIERI